MCLHVKINTGFILIFTHFIVNFKGEKVGTAGLINAEILPDDNSIHAMDNLFYREEKIHNET